MLRRTMIGWQDARSASSGSAGCEAAGLGAYIELVYGRMNAAEYGRTIRAVGPASFVLSTDLGQPNNLLHPDGMIAFFEAMRKEGISVADIERMAKTNPAQALGLP